MRPAQIFKRSRADKKHLSGVEDRHLDLLERMGHVDYDRRGDEWKLNGRYDITLRYLSCDCSTTETDSKLLDLSELDSQGTSI